MQLVAKASEKGLNADGSMTHEANLDTGYVDDDRHWWVQAETVVGFYNIYQHFGDEAALQKALHCWQYIKDNLIDNELGEWYWSRDPQRNINRKDDHAGFWKCPYHNSRMCLEIIERSLSEFSYIANSKLFLTDNNYQSYQSSANKKHKIKIFWNKIGKIGNYCQFSIEDAFILNSSNSP